MDNLKKVLCSLYKPPKDSHKGQNGKLLIIGGSRQYHGAVMLSVLAARRFVDLVYAYVPDEDRYAIKGVKTIPEVIVKRKIDTDFIRKMDAVLFGVGLGKSKFNITKLKTQNSKLVIDGDGLKLIKGKIPKGCIITPHEAEFKMLFGLKGTEKNVRIMAKKHKCIILKKGPIDIISDGTKLKVNKTHNQGMTKGGTGDVLAGLVAALYCKNPGFQSAVAGTYLAGLTGNILKKQYGHNFCASDVANKLSETHKKATK